MNLSDAEILSFLTGQNSLLDSTLASFTVREQAGAVAAEFLFTARIGADYDQVKLTFECVSEFDFTYSADYIFGNVENLKFTRTDDGQFYLSLDPDLIVRQPSERDQDFVRARKVVAHMTRRGERN